MPTPADTLIRDATPLYDAARSLHGYFLFRWLREYLNVALGNIQRWSQAGMLGSDGRPNAAFRQCLVDFNALDLEILAQLCGLYFYIHAGHKQANHALGRHTTDRKSTRLNSSHESQSRLPSYA